jgi:hypothetical protein
MMGLHKQLATVVITMALCSRFMGNAYLVRPSSANLRNVAMMKWSSGFPLNALMRLRGAGEEEEEDSDDSMPTVRRSGNAQNPNSQNRSRNVNIVFIGHVDSGILRKTSLFLFGCVCA